MYTTTVRHDDVADVDDVGSTAALATVSLQIAEELASRLKLQLIPKEDRQYRSQQALQRERRVALEQKLQELCGDQLGMTIYTPAAAAKVRTVIQTTVTPRCAVEIGTDGAKDR